jgi:hypothetical protein
LKNIEHLIQAQTLDQEEDFMIKWYREKKLYWYNKIHWYKGYDYFSKKALTNIVSKLTKNQLNQLLNTSFKGTKPK